MGLLFRVGGPRCLSLSASYPWIDFVLWVDREKRCLGHWGTDKWRSGARREGEGRVKKAKSEIEINRRGKTRTGSGKMGDIRRK